MNFLMFYGTIGSLNHFTDELCAQFRHMRHSVVVIDLCTDYRETLERIIEEGIDAAVCYDCFGMSNKDLYDQWKIPIINILMDHPMRLDFYIKEPPKKYVQLSPDKNHVYYTKRFLGVENVFFLPHMASLCTDFHCISEQGKNIGIMFPGGLKSPNVLLERINTTWTSPSVKKLALSIIEYLLAAPWNTLEEAMNQCLADRHMELPDTTVSLFLGQCRDIDYFIRMYFREKVVNEIIKADIPITIIGGGWGDEYISQSNVTLLPGKKFAEIFPYMERSKITLTVMPWFKAGTHDRIFNALMHYSCPLTDESSWLLEHLKPDKDCAYYSLTKITDIPDKIYDLLSHPESREKIIQNGRKKVMDNYTSKQIAEKILYYLVECYG